MGLEIERRFLVHGCDWRRHVCWQANLQQGYLVASADGFTVRVRRASGDKAVAGAWLTLKARSEQCLEAVDLLPEGLVRQEFEYTIPEADADALLALAPQRLCKVRYGLDLPGGEWVLDVFEGANAPLLVAEVELEPQDLKQGLALKPPAWCGRELTGRHELSNLALARRPLALWPEAERLALFEPADI
ncbi:MAG: adenylate cyclase [Cyanobacteria bacterium]|nr:adenylate cyclase [Cyanobacteriota bacterium]MDA1245907.1 adenylate cyclase [Cyanobacteriota bacterium]